MTQYSEAQIMCGLRSVWPDMTGTDATFDASTRLDEYMKADGSWDELDFAIVFNRLEHFFCFACTLDEWKALFRFDLAGNPLEWQQTIGPQLAFGALAHFIADRTKAIAFEPVTILGKYCPPAGVFRGIEELVARTNASELHFGPSSPINDVLKGNRLDRFWTQLRWMTQDSIPELPSSWSGAPKYAFGVGCLSILLGAIGAGILGGFLPLLAAGILAMALYLATSLFKQAVNPLPADLQTFRELAMLIAASDCDAVRGSH